MSPTRTGPLKMKRSDDHAQHGGASAAAPPQVGAYDAPELPEAEPRSRPVTSVPRAAHLLDLALGLAGLALGWMSPWFPLGRDQGLYHYVAREWVMRGAVPYRDVFDHKTPGIYMLNALAIAVFGENTWGIRVLELGGVLLIGLMAATFTVARGERVAPGVRGAAIFAAGVLNFGLLNFWNLAQSEIWYSLLGVGSVWAARRIARTARAQTASGVIAAAAIVMKPPAACFVIVALAVLLARERAARADWLRAAASGLARFAAGATAVLLPVLGYFVVTGALPDMIEIVVHTNRFYAEHETEVHSFKAALRHTAGFLDLYPPVHKLFAYALVVVTLVALAMRDATRIRQHLLACALVAAGIAAVAVQRKFYPLHWTALLAPLSVIAALAAADARVLLDRSRARVLAPLAFPALLLGCWLSSATFDWWLITERQVVDHLAGRSTLDAFANYFDFPPVDYVNGDSERAGRWIYQHSQPSDTIAVRAFEPQIYAIAHRRYPGRFFWTTYLTQETRAEPERRARFREEDRLAFARTPPRYVVALVDAGNDIDNPDYFHPLGYAPRARFGRFEVLEWTGQPYREGTP